MADSVDLEFKEALLACGPKGRPPTHRGDKSQQVDGGQLPFQALALQQAPSQPSKKTVTAFCFVVLRVEIGFSFQCKKLS